jgi:hypothetical protein
MTRRVVLVTGPPSAGKTTWVRGQASATDVVVDLDELDSDTSERARLERHVAQMHDGTAWVIRTAAEPTVRAEIAARLGATESTVIATPEDVALRRAADQPDEYRQAITRWWKNFAPRDGEHVIGADAMSEEQTEPTEPQEPSKVETSAVVDELGESGKKALAVERAARKEAEKKAKRADELEAELVKLREDAMSEQEKAIAVARKEAAAEARQEATSEAARRLFRAEVKAAAASTVADPELLADPDVAMRLLGFDEVPVTESGDVDAEAISAALDRLVERKPYLAVGDRQPVPGADQGARGTTVLSQLTREQLKTMSPEQITRAETEGRLDVLLGRRRT